MFSTSSKFLKWLIPLALILGTLLRLLWIGDMEYKYDENLAFSQSQTIGVTEPWPWLGATSSTGLRNPPLALWIFPTLATISGAKTPLELDRAIQILNIFALFSLFFFVRFIIPERDRTIWYWGLALACVNPLAIIYERKIWSISMYPIFCILNMTAWFKRENKWGALGWGFMGAVLGNIHLGGFFIAASLFLFTFAQDRLSGVRARWGYWVLGSVLGTLPMVPWIQYAMDASSESTVPGYYGALFHLQYWQTWFDDALGRSLDSSLGPENYARFKSMFFYLPDLALTLVLALGLGFIAAWAYRRFVKHKRAPKTSGDTLILSAFFGNGLLLSLTGRPLYRHYLIVTYPLEWVWIAKLALQNISFEKAYLKHLSSERLLFLLWSLELFLAVSFLYYIHINHGAPGGDYWYGYQYQGH